MLNNFNKFRLRKRISLPQKKIFIKKLSFGLKNSGGRNGFGRITAFQRGGGCKRVYKVIDFKRDLFCIWNKKGLILQFEYDTNRSAYLALVLYENGFLSYVLAAENLKVGDSIYTGLNVPLLAGNTLPLKYIPLGAPIHNVNGIYIRSAGTSGKLIARFNKLGFGILVLSSGKKIKINLNFLATLGVVSNSSHHLYKYYKAGQSRLLNKRPNVRGVAMNPIDHPMGGGEGKTSGGRPSVSPWGKLTKGYITKRNKKYA